MHIGAIILCEGPPPSYEDLISHIDARLDMVPRYRQKLAQSPLSTGRPFWIDDCSFNLEYHIRHSALPAPGSEEQLRNTAARIFSQQLDRTKPLWELWLIQGLKNNRFALISKTHHAVVDGVSGVDIATILFDLKPQPKAARREKAWVPTPEPSSADLVARNAGDYVSTPVGLARGILGALEHPGRALEQFQIRAEALSEVAGAMASSAPDVPLNTEIGAHRRYEWVRCELADLKRIKKALGGTVNDVVLTVVAGALRGWLRARGIRTEGMELRALVPVSIRAEGDGGELGNQIAAMRGPLPVYIEDPELRLERVRSEMDDLKESKQALGAEVISRFNDFAPPTLLAQASRLNFSTRLFNLIVTNVPGPQFPLYVLGRELEAVFPVAFLPENHALALAIMSYNGGLNFGLLADYDAMEDVGLIADGIKASVEELLVAAAAAEQRDAESSATEGVKA